MTLSQKGFSLVLIEMTLGPPVVTLKQRTTGVFLSCLDEDEC